MTREIFTLRNTLFGLASWLIPFLASFTFYTPDGQLMTDVFLFKSAMILVGGLVGVWLLVMAFRRVTPGLASGLALGFFWAVLNWALDLIVLVGVMGAGFGPWFIGVGLRYLMLPIMAAGMGAVGAAPRG